MLIKTQIRNVLYDNGRPWVGGKKKRQSSIGVFFYENSLIDQLRNSKENWKMIWKKEIKLTKQS